MMWPPMYLLLTTVIWQLPVQLLAHEMVEVVLWSGLPLDYEFTKTEFSTEVNNVIGEFPEDQEKVETSEEGYIVEHHPMTTQYTVADSPRLQNGNSIRMTECSKTFSWMRFGCPFGDGWGCLENETRRDEICPYIGWENNFISFVNSGAGSWSPQECHCCGECPLPFRIRYDSSLILV